MQEYSMGDWRHWFGCDLVRVEVAPVAALGTGFCAMDGFRVRVRVILGTVLGTDTFWAQP